MYSVYLVLIHAKQSSCHSYPKPSTNPPKSWEPCMLLQLDYVIRQGLHKHSMPCFCTTCFHNWLWLVVILHYSFFERGCGQICAVWRTVALMCIGVMWCCCLLHGCRGGGAPVVIYGSAEGNAGMCITHHRNPRSTPYHPSRQHWTGQGVV